MHNLSKISSVKKKSPVSKERLQIRNFVLSSIVFSVFAVVCSLSISSSINDPYKADRLQNKLGAVQIVGLHIIGLGTLILGKKDE